MQSKHIGVLSQSDFILKVGPGSGVVLVDFGAEWCPPCKALIPTLEQISRDYRDQVKVFSVDTDKNPELAAQFGIRGLPTVIVFQDGIEIETLVGRHPYESYESVLNEMLVTSQKRNSSHR